MSALAEWLATWASYRPSDFLMFAPRSYWRLVAGLNAASWPLQAAWLAAGLAAVALLLGRHRWALRGLCGLLAAACAATAVSWHLQRYASINSGAPWLAFAFFVQAALLLLAAWHGGAVRSSGDMRSTVGPPGSGESRSDVGEPGSLGRQSGANAPGSAGMHRSGGARRRAGIGLVLAALPVYPSLGAAVGRPLAQAECFGLMPDPTLLALLGGALLLGRWWLWPLPLAGCALAGTALWTMNEPLAPLLPAAALFAVSVAAASARRARAA